MHRMFFPSVHRGPVLFLIYSMRVKNRKLSEKDPEFVVVMAAAFRHWLGNKMDLNSLCLCRSLAEYECLSPQDTHAGKERVRWCCNCVLGQQGIRFYACTRMLTNCVFTLHYPSPSMLWPVRGPLDALCSACFAQHDLLCSTLTDTL